MNTAIKKVCLIYLLFLFTTVSGNSIQADEPFSASPDRNLELQEEKAFPENTSVQIPSFSNENSTLRNKAVISGEAENSGMDMSAGITPAFIEIPVIDVHAEIVKVGTLANGEMGVPEDIDTIGWYEPGFKPGSAGNAVMAGHVDGASEPGAFFHLKELKAGDEIHLTGANGEKLTFSVTEKVSYLPQDAPLAKIFGDSPEVRLNLITCTGDFNYSTGNYEERLVVYTKLIEG